MEEFVECYKNDVIMKVRRVEKKWWVSMFNFDLIFNFDLKWSDFMFCNWWMFLDVVNISNMLIIIVYNSLN